jgi:regulatory protein
MTELKTELEKGLNQEFKSELNKESNKHHRTELNSDVNAITDVNIGSYKAKIRVSALNLLARREHSLKELKTKLQKRYSDSCCGLIDDILDVLKEDNLQSNCRFAESYLRSRVNKGQGQYRIESELQQRGVAESDIYWAFQQEPVDWLRLARNVAHKRFGETPPLDLKERAQRCRFLQYRGFSNDQIEYALGR